MFVMSPSVRVARLPDQPMPSISLPQHEILEGVPDARAVFTAESADRGACAGFWSCDVGRYEFVFDYDEFIYLIEGEVTVIEAPPSTQSYVLRAGDTAHFPQGITTIWQVTRRMTKYFVARAPFAQ
jgi:uncharacterized cupin superfamily protein